MITNEIIYAFSLCLLFILVLSFWMFLRLFFLTTKIDKLIDTLEMMKPPSFAPQGSGERDKDEKRFKYRAKSHLTGVILAENGAFPVDIHDISKTGALLQSLQFKLKLGEVYTMRFLIDGKGEFDLSVKPVRHTSDHHYGVLFQNASLSTLREISDYISGLALQELNQDPDTRNV